MIIYTIGASPYAAVLVVGLAFLLDLVPEDRMGEFVGIYYVVWSVPQAVAPVVGGTLIDMAGYRSMFPAETIFMMIGLIIFSFIRSPVKAENPL